MSIELYGTEAMGNLFLRLIRRVSKALGQSEGVALLLFIAVAVVGILSFTFYDSFARDVKLNSQQHVTFQHMVGGLGMGAISSPRWCLHAFDPRLESICYATAYPVPGTYAYCTYDTTVVTGFEDRGEKTHFLLLRAPDDKEHEKAPEAP